MQIDLGSVAKGYTGDCILEQFRNQGVTSAILNLGGNVQTLGAKPDGSPWRVAITDPVSAGNAGMVEIIGKAVVTSGGYERYFEEDGVVYRHIMDPSSGYPVDNDLLSVSIIGDSGLVCDALSTALFVMGLDRAAAFWKAWGSDSNGACDFEAVFITVDGKIYITEGLEDSFSPLGTYKGTEPTVIYHD
jgi:thiamine biosynthesis lipoprotein